MTKLTNATSVGKHFETIDTLSERRRQESLLTTEALQKAIFDSANFSSIATDAKGVIQIFNVGAERMLGYTAAEVMNKITPADISDPKEVIARAEALSLELDTTIAPGFEALVFKASRGIEDIYELSYIRKDGSRFPAVVSVTALRDDQDVIIGYLLIGTDNTARQQIEVERAKLDQRLRDQQFYVRSLIEFNIDAIMTTDPQGIVTDVNKQMEVLTGCTRDELIGAPFKNYYTDPARAEAGIKRALAKGKVTDYELTARSRDGTETVVSYNATTFYDRDRKLQGVYAAARDITERKRLDLTLQEKNIELIHATRKKSEFLATMSHEIRTPMNAVIGLAQLALETELNTQQHNYLSKILDSSRSLLGILNDVLDYSKIEAGKLQLEKREFDLESVFQNTIGLFSIGAEIKGIELAFDIAQDVPHRLIGDSLRMRQVLNNIVGNAIKFTEHGHVQVTARCLLLQKDEVHLEFSVRDTGIGMTEGQLSRLFHEFEQADSSTTRKFGGTGLGLSISKRLIELMGGEIRAQSEFGVGSIFTFTLHNQIAVGTPLTARAPDRLRGMRTLIVDDQPVSCEVLRSTLEHQKFDISIANSGEAGLAAVIEAYHNGQPFELLLVDWMMPGMDGIEMIRRVRELEATSQPTLQHAIAVMVTSHGRESVSQAAADVHLDAILDKPVLPSTLFDVVIGLQGFITQHPNKGYLTDLQHQFNQLKRIRGARILLVEDNLTNQMVASEFLEKMGLVVQLANNGAQALEKVQQSAFDVILMDLQMPVMDGFEATRRIRTLAQGDHIPIIALTASAMLKDKQDSEAAGMNDFIAKPIDISELAAVLLRVLPRDIYSLSGLPVNPDFKINETIGRPFEAPGLDLLDAAQRMRDDWHLLRRTLHSFANNFGNAAHELQVHLGRQHIQDAVRLVHSIKGLAKSIGASALYHASAQLEADLQINPHQNCQLFEVELTKALGAIAQIPKADLAPQAIFNAARTNELLQEVSILLAESGFVPPVLVDELRGQLADGLHATQVDTLLQQIDLFNYPLARNALTNLKTQLKSAASE